MPEGIIVRNDDGGVQFDSSWPLGRILGSVAAGGASGSVSVPGFADGVPWAMIVGASQPPEPMSAPAGQPTVNITGTTLNWTVADVPLSCTIMYGTY